MRHSFIVIILLFFYSCIEVEGRRPKKHATQNFYKEIIKENKKINAREKYFLENLIAKDTINQYETSSTGFWYAYVKKNLSNSETPKMGDMVTIEYNVTDIENNILYAKQQIQYKIDKQDFIPALQDGIKLMKKGEIITFVIPSYRAYGVVGDEKKIGINQPIKSTVKLIEINKNKKNENK